MSGKEPLSWRWWQGNAVVFHPLSGDTQVLDVASAEVVRFMGQSGAQRVDILHRLSVFLELDETEELDRAVTQILGKLDDLGIIEPVYECS